MSNTVIAILVLIVILLVGWVGYTQGYFDRAQQEDSRGLNIQLGGTGGAQ